MDLQIGDHYNCKEMIVEAIDLFNQRLSSSEVEAQYRLKDDVGAIEENYVLYIAKKKGTPKEDFPGLSLSSSVKKLTYERFCLCCNTSAFERMAGLNQNSSYEANKDLPASEQPSTKSSLQT